MNIKEYLEQKKRENEVKNNRPFLGGSGGGTANSIGHQKDLKTAMQSLYEKGKLSIESEGKGFTFFDKKALEQKAGTFNDYLTATEGTQLSRTAVGYELLQRRFGMPNSITGALGVYSFVGKNLRLPMDNTAFGVAIVDELGDTPIATPSTSELIVEPRKLATAVQMSSEFFEDVEPTAYDSLLNNMAYAFTKAEEDLIIFDDVTGLQATANVGATPITFTADTIDAMTNFKNSVFQSMRFMDADYIDPNNMVLIAHSGLYPYMGNMDISNVVYTDKMAPDGTGNLPLLWVNKRAVVLALRENYSFEMIRKDNFQVRLEAMERFEMALPYINGTTGKNRGASLVYVDTP